MPRMFRLVNRLPLPVEYSIGVDDKTLAFAFAPAPPNEANGRTPDDTFILASERYNEIAIPDEAIPAWHGGDGLSEFTNHINMGIPMEIVLADAAAEGEETPYLVLMPADDLDESLTANDAAPPGILLN